MRPILAAVAALAILGSVGLYQKFTQSLLHRKDHDIELRRAEGVFDVEVTLTFDAAADAFTADRQTSVLVMFRGRPLLQIQEPVKAGTPLKIENVSDLAQGQNEFLVEITAADQEPNLARGVRVRIFRDDAQIAEQTLWAEPGQPVQGAVVVDIPKQPSTTEPTDH